MNKINKNDYDCDECLKEAIVKQQLLADLNAYIMWVEDEDWDEAENAAINCNNILQAFIQDNIDNCLIDTEYITSILEVE